MKPTNGKILVRANMEQKDSITVGGVTMSTANKFENNFREKSPVVCVVVEGNKDVQKDDILIVHHNTLYQPSPYYVQDDLFSIPFTSIIFAKLSASGDLIPLNGNILCDRPKVESTLPLPPSQQKLHIDRVVVRDAGREPYKKDQLLFIRQHAYYEIVYNINGEGKRVHKVHGSMVVGFAH